jgi:hypothetical protein
VHDFAHVLADSREPWLGRRPAAGPLAALVCAANLSGNTRSTASTRRRLEEAQAPCWSFSHTPQLSQGL